MDRLVVPIVYDSHGKPVVACLVFLQYSEDRAYCGTTDSLGMLALDVDASLSDSQISVLAAGYQPYSQHVHLGKGNLQIRIGLAADPSRTEDVILPALTDYLLPIMEPTREQVCKVYCGFQGISILTREYGWIPAFGPETTSLADDDLISYCKQMKGFGFTHVEFDISWRYTEADYSYPVPGRDLSQNLAEVCRRCNIIIEQGMLIKFSLAGDGLSVGDFTSYNDPQGWTYGYEWLCNNVSRILTALKNYSTRDLTKFIIFVPGYDGVFYGWGRDGEVPDRQPERVINFGRLFRSILPNGYLGIEHTPGNIPVGEGSDNWKTGGVLDPYDTLFGEFDPFNYHQDSTWQILGRMCEPYYRPDDQPVNDDPNPDYYLFDCTRGKRFYIIYELKTYRWVRGCPVSEVLECARYFNSMAPTTTICALLN
jgi:hypothetical protein